jgi:hypothetical protein
MSQKKIIVVFGATGAQGGGLARAILNDKNSEFAVRAVTRDPNSDKAKALAAMGAEVVEADLAHPDKVLKAMEGAYGAFCVTFFWAHFSPEQEAAEAKCMADAAKAAGLKHVTGLPWKTPGYMSPCTTTGCLRCKRNIRFPISTARANRTDFLLKPKYPLPCCSLVFTGTT